MLQRHEGYMQGHGGLTLFFQTWTPPSPRGSLLITHGQGEHSECYHRVIEALKEQNWSFWAWDMRGHGRSEGKRGYAAHFEDYVRDFQIVLRRFLEENPESKGPRVLLSHSMGGLLQLKTLIEAPQTPIAAQVCSAPLLGVAVEVPTWKDAGAKLMNQIFPQITMWNELHNHQLTRDPDVVREFEQDVLRHNRISPGVYLGMHEAFSFVGPRADLIQTPTLFQLPEADPVVSTPASTAFFEKLGSPQKTLKIYGDGARHEMYNDLHREQVFADLKGFLQTYLGGK